MANRAVLVAWRAQVMERRRDHPQSGLRRSRRRTVGMALQTHDPHLLPREHTGVRRSVRFVTAPAALKPHRRMLERERSPLVAMTAETARFVGRELHHAGPET